jgi:hypothetical protein
MQCDSRFWEDRSGLEQTSSAFLFRNLREAQCSSTVRTDDVAGSWALRSKLDFAPLSGSHRRVGTALCAVRTASSGAMIGSASPGPTRIPPVRCTWMMPARRAIPVQWGSAKMRLVQIDSCLPRLPQNVALNKSHFCPGVNHPKPPAS